MIAPTASIARLARQARATSVPLLATGLLATGLLATACGTTHAAGTGAPGAGAAAADTTAGPATSPSPSAASPSAAPTPRATPVPTVTGGAVTAGGPACAGWPAKAPHRAMTAAFKPVAVERCVTGFTKVPGKGEWETATLEKAAKNLEPLIAALLLPSARHTPGTICPDLAVIPPQIVLIDAAGGTLVPLLPLSGCGQVAAQVYVALNELRWQTVSVRLIAPLRQSADVGQAESGSPRAVSTLPAVTASHAVTAG